MTRDPNVLLIVVDCLRGDRVAGARSCQTPALDQLVWESVLYTQAIASTSSTTPSFASLLTGCYPPRHGIRGLRGYRLGDVKTLAELLRARGYHTRAEVTGPLLPQVGLDRGFDAYVFRAKTDDSGPWWPGIRDVLKSLPRPWFALVHIWDLHMPREIHPELDWPAYGKTRYDRAVSTLDRNLPFLLNSISADDLVILTGDHGEMLERRRGHAFLSLQGRRLLAMARRIGLVIPAYDRIRRAIHVGHGFHLYEELIRVPLVIRAAGVGDPSVRSHLVSHVDVVPTVLDLLGLSIPPWVEGRSLLRPPDDKRAIYLESTGGQAQGLGRPVQGVRTPTHKYLRSLDPPLEEWLFDLAQDPGERQNVARAHPDLVASLRGQMEPFLRESPPAARMSPEEEALVTKRLEELGYLE